MDDHILEIINGNVFFFFQIEREGEIVINL